MRACVAIRRVKDCVAIRRGGRCDHGHSQDVGQVIYAQGYIRLRVILGSGSGSGSGFSSVLGLELGLLDTTPWPVIGLGLLDTAASAQSSA